MTTVNQEFERVAMHAVRLELLRQQADMADLPLHLIELPWPCSNEEYERRMTAFIDEVKAMGVAHIAFGDLYLEDVRDYRIRQLDGTGITAVFPIWGQHTRKLAEQMVDAGLRAILTCVDPKLLSADFAGREFNSELVNDLPAEIDPCGENGEFHSFAFAGPMFTHPIPVTAGDVVNRDGFVFADLLPLRAG